MHPGTLVSISSLASLLQDQGELNQAELLFREALKASRDTLGGTHPRTLASANNLGAHVSEEVERGRATSQGGLGGSASHIG